MNALNVIVRNRVKVLVEDLFLMKVEIVRRHRQEATSTPIQKSKNIQSGIHQSYTEFARALALVRRCVPIMRVRPLHKLSSSLCVESNRRGLDSTISLSQLSVKHVESNKRRPCLFSLSLCALSLIGVGAFLARHFRRRDACMQLSLARIRELLLSISFACIRCHGPRHGASACQAACEYCASFGT